jgi:hypothetical protein
MMRWFLAANPLVTLIKFILCYATRRGAQDVWRHHQFSSILEIEDVATASP